MTVPNKAYLFANQIFGGGIQLPAVGSPPALLVHFILVPAVYKQVSFAFSPS